MHWHLAKTIWNVFFKGNIIGSCWELTRAIITKDWGCAIITTHQCTSPNSMVLKDFPFSADATESVCTAPLFQEMEHHHHIFSTLLSSNQISLHPKELPQRNIPRASQVRNVDHWLAVSRLTACSSVLLYTSLTPLLLFEFTLSNWGASRSYWHSSKKRPLS